MIQTIHLINVAKKKKKILVTANIELDTLQSEEDIQKAFEEVLPKALKITQKKPNQTAANFLQTAMAMVNERYTDIVYLSVNEDRRKGNPKTAINFNFKIHFMNSQMSVHNIESRVQKKLFYPAVSTYTVLHSFKSRYIF